MSSFFVLRAKNAINSYFNFNSCTHLYGTKVMIITTWVINYLKPGLESE
jgi:hypothetical protein